MTSIDTGLFQYKNQPLKIPTAAKQVQGTGAQIAPGGKIDKKSELYKQCQDFESIFVKMMIGEMQKTVEKGSLMNGGYAEDIFSDMLQDEYSKSMTKTSDFGIADMLYRQLK
jgi:Rod binding domain-containing protein